MRKQKTIPWLVRVMMIGVIVLVVGACSQPTGGDPPSAEPAGASPTDADPTGDGEDDPTGDSASDPPAEDPIVDPQPPEVRSLAIDFQTATEGVVAEGFDGSGAVQEPAPGQLDADAWEVLGFSDGDRLFGEESTTGDHARGTSDGAVSTGGLYAFTVEDGNVALGVQPTAGDFAPGSVTLKVPLELWPQTKVTLGYTVWVYNDQDRSTSWSVAYSLDGENWSELDETSFLTPEPADPATAWTPFAFTVETVLDFLPNLHGHDGLYIRWTGTDSSGTGGRDEAAIDDIMVSLASDT
jgi:hypothetical protein